MHGAIATLLSPPTFAGLQPTKLWRRCSCSRSCSMAFPQSSEDVSNRSAHLQSPRHPRTLVSQTSDRWPLGVVVPSRLTGEVRFVLPQASKTARPHPTAPISSRQTLGCLPDARLEVARTNAGMQSNPIPYGTRAGISDMSMTLCPAAPRRTQCRVARGLHSPNKPPFQETCSNG
jgi:hypothetical protein